MFYFKHESELRGGIGWTAEDTNIESAGVLDPDPDPPITDTSAGALDLITTLIPLTPAIIPLTRAIIDIDNNFFIFIFIILFFTVFFYFYI